MRMKKTGAIERPYKNSPLRWPDPNPGATTGPAFQRLGTAHRDLVGRTERFHEGVALETGGQVVDQHFGAAIDNHAETVRDGRMRSGAGVDAGVGGQAGD